MAFVYYYYNPNKAAAGIYIVLFGLSTILHFFQLIRSRTWFMIPFVIGGVLETVGYIGRILSGAQAPDFALGPYVMQSTTILVAPAFFAASIYMTLGRVIRMLHGEQHSVIRLNWLTKIFVSGDVLSFLMQASGAGLMAASSSGPTTGEHIIDGGLAVQIIFFGFFIITSVAFDLRMRRSAIKPDVEVHRIWRRQMLGLYITSIMIFVRSVVRLAEYVQGFDGFIARHEAFIYIFDGLLMLVVMFIMHFAHPSQVSHQMLNDYAMNTVPSHDLNAEDA